MKIHFLLPLSVCCLLCFNSVVSGSDNARHLLPNGKLNLENPTIQRLRTNLFVVNSNSKKNLIDGTLSEYSENYNSDLDGNDARKLTNSGLNISIFRAKTNIIIERRRSIEITDSIPFRIWGAGKNTYQFEFVTNAFDNRLTCVLEDHYLHSSTPIQFNDTTKVQFTINNDPASADPFRFTIVFNAMRMTALPFSLTSFNTNPDNKGIGLNWNTANEGNIRQYVIEKSLDGSVFFNVAIIKPKKFQYNNYMWTDEGPASLQNFYRIRAIEWNNKVYNSPTIKASTNSLAGITVFPVPAMPWNFNLQMTHQPAGNYLLELINPSGQALWQRTINYNGYDNRIILSSSTSIPKGLYYLKIKDPFGGIRIIKVLF